MDFATHLDLHRARRSAGTPTVTVCPGEPLPQLDFVTATDLEEVAAEWLRRAASTHDLLAAAARFLAPRLGRDAESLHLELERKSAAELTHFLQLHAPSWSAEVELIAFRWCLGAQSRETFGDPLKLLRGCARLLPEDSLPELWFAPSHSDLTWLSGAAQVAATIAESIPALPVGIVAPARLLEEFLRDNHGRAGALLREGLLDVRAVSPDVRAGDARSQAEAFLFDRLNDFSQTAGAFELNAVLECEGQRLEVDLLDRQLRVAVEIDGYFHFADLDAYRRDRRKDLLLQRAGFVVVRCLAEDVVTRLEEILRTITDVRAWRGRQPR